MKKAAIAVAIITAGAVGYWAVKNQSSSLDSNPVLEYIPADTVIFSGSLADFRHQANRIADKLMISEQKLHTIRIFKFRK